MTNTSGTKCPKCQKTQFELVEDRPDNSVLILVYLRCAACHTFLSHVYHSSQVGTINQIRETVQNILKKLG